MSLQARIDEIAAQEREWLAQGHPVGIVSNTVEWWNERGIFTAADLDAHFAGDAHATAADLNYHMGREYEAWLDEQECDAPMMEPEVEGDFPFNPVYAVAQQFQSGWL